MARRQPVAGHKFDAIIVPCTDSDFAAPCSDIPAPVLPGIAENAGAMVALRRQIHANPELGYEEFATSDLVAERLTRWGYAVHRGLGGTGVVGTLALRRPAHAASACAPTWTRCR